MSIVNDPNSSPPSDSGIQAAWHRAHERPLTRFIVSEVQGGIASLTVYAFFLFISAAAERLTDWIALKNQAPAHFLDWMFAWGAALSGGVTFAMITFCELIRLGLDLLQRGDR